MGLGLPGVVPGWRSTCFPSSRLKDLAVLNDIFAAAAHGAGLVYHEIVAAEADVTKWEADNPAIKPLLDAGAGYASIALAGAGVPVPAFVTVGTAVLSALKLMAAVDPTVQCGGVTPSASASATP